MKNHPENVINSIMKNAWSPHIRDDTARNTPEHTLAWPYYILFYFIFFPFAEASE